MDATRTTWPQKILLILLAFIFVFGLSPMGNTTYAYADSTGGGDSSGTFYLSISDDDKYVTSDGEIAGTTMAYVPMSIDEIAKIDLDDYGLGDYKYDKDGDGKYETTLLMAFIYALNNYYSGTTTNLQVSGSPGSLFLADGFWGHDCNLTYYVNGAYPLASPGWGATADQIVISDDDFADVSMYTSWSFYSDSLAGYHYFLDGSGAITHSYSAVAGVPLTVSLGRAWGDIMMGGDTELVKEANYSVSYGDSYLATAAKTATTDSNGAAQITFDQGGTYVLWANGGYGEDNPTDIVNAPAYAVVNVLAVDITTETLDAATVGEEYSATLSAAGANLDQYTWSIDDGTLPAGLTLSDKGVISGTPTATGESTFTVKIDSGVDSATKELTLTVGSLPVVTTTTLADATVDAEYSATLEATGYPDDFSWWTTIGGLPEGLTMSDKGVISGTPTEAGIYTISVIASNEAGMSAVKELTLTVNGAPSINTTELASGTVNQEYSATLDISGSPAPTVEVVGLPTGLTFNTATNTISGTPTVAKTFNVKITATNAGGSDSAELELTINDAPQIKTDALDSAAVGTAYSQDIEVSGTPAPTVTVTDLPEGLTYNADTKKIEGTPAAGTGGVHSVTITASNGAGEDAIATLDLAVSEKASIVTESLDEAYLNKEYTATIETYGYPDATILMSASSTLPAGLSMSADGVISGTPTETGSFTISVMAFNTLGASKMKTFTLVVGENTQLKSFIMHSGYSPDATNTLIMNEGDPYSASAIFNPDTYEYTTASVLDSVTQMRFRPVVSDTGATATLYYGEDMASSKEISWTSGMSKFVNDCFTGGGMNTLKLVVDPAAGSTLESTTYTIHVPVTPTLTSLSATGDAGDLYFDKNFAAGTNEYTLTASASTTTIDFAAVARSDGYSVTYNGDKSSEVNISGIDKVEIAVTGGTGDDAITNTYTVNLDKVDSYSVKFNTNPADALVSVTDSTGAVVEPNESGEYVGLFGELEYTYAVTKSGYVSASGTMPAQNTTINVKLQQAGDQPASVDSDWWNFRNSANNMGITSATTPIDQSDTSLNWAKKLGTGWAAAPSQPIIVDNALVTCVGTTIYKLDLHTGETLASGTMTTATNWGYTPMTYANGMIFVPISGGVQAFNASTLESLWVYKDSKGGQSLSPIVYSDGYVYTGFWNSEIKDANYVCLSVTDEDPTQTTEAKLASWTYAQTGGFYWAGGVAIGDKIIVGTDDGTSSYDQASHLLVFNKTTGAVEQSLDITGDQRSSIAYDEANGQIWFTTKCGYLYRANVNATTGEVSNLTGVNFGAQCTATPVVYKGKVYIGTGSGISSSGSNGNIAVFDATTMNMLYYKPLNGYPQSSLLLSTAYEESTGYIYLYSTYNMTPGGITMLKLSADATTADEVEKVELYDAAGYSQYCISSIICGTDGTLYYKNDSGNILAVGKTYEVPVITTTELEDATTDTEYTATLAATAYPEDITWALAEGRTLPTGLSMSADGVISGTPTETGIYTISVIASNDAGDSEITDLTLNVNGVPSVSTTELPDGMAEQAYSAQLEANSTDEVTWMLKDADALPEGLTLTDDGAISGTPAEAGDYTIEVIAINKYGASAPATVTLHIDGYAPEIITESLENGTYGKAYKQVIEASGQPAANIYVSGLPKGLTASNGVISGTPTETGTFEVKIVASNEYGTTAAQTISLTIKTSTTWTRLFGENRYETMAAIDKAGYADDSASKIILASGEGYADALSASGLAGLWNAPVILSASGSLSAEAAAEIERVSDGNATVYIVGGEKSISTSAEAAVAAITGVSGTQRIAGSDRIDTGLKIYAAGEGSWSKTAVITSAWGFADGLSIGSWASAAGAPVFGATTDGILTADEIEAIEDGGFTNIVVVGGDNSVNLDAVKAQLPDSISYVRLAGDNRYETSATIVNWATGNAELSDDIAFQPSVVLDYNNMAVASGQNFPDALAAIDLIGPTHSVLLLVDESDTTKANIAATIGANASDIVFGYVLGGQLAVSDTVKAWCEEATK